MELSRDIVIDLLPAYLAGDASDTTRRMVDQYLLNDAELSRLVKNTATQGLHVPIALPPDRHKEAFDRSKRLIRRQAWFQAAAVFFTLVVFSLEWRDGRFHFLMARQGALGGVYAAAAVACWIGYFKTQARLRVQGM